MVITFAAHRNNVTVSVLRSNIIFWKSTAVFVDSTRLGMSKSMCDEISQFAAALLLYPVSENGRPPY